MRRTAQGLGVGFVRSRSNDRIRPAAGEQLVSMQQNCPECQRLWREYAAATNTHVGLESKLRLALLRQPDTASVEAITRDIASAAKLRDSLRQAIQQHEAAHEGAAAADSDS
jgi:hypothetical protein